MRPLLDIRDLRVAFDTGQGQAEVVRGVDLQVDRGEILGLVGESGSGKSVSCLAAMGLLEDNARLQGTLYWDGHPLPSRDDRAMSRRRGRDLAMIFQDPMSALNPVQAIGQQLGEAIRLHAETRLSRGEVRRRAIALLEDVGVPAAASRLKAFPHQLSGGLNQRVVIAMMLAGEPRLLIADEPTTALDVTVQAQIIELLQRLRDARGMSIILVTHDLGVVAEACDRVVVMYGGQVVERGPVAALFDTPRHPYTRGLLASLPRLDDRAALTPIPGTVPAPHELHDGCAFAARCPRAEPGCRQRLPPPQDDAPGHGFRCFHPHPATPTREFRP